MLLRKSKTGGLIDDNPFAIIIDLGIAEMFDPSDPQGKELGGTPTTMAPEVWNGNFGPKCDVWSLGCILFELLTFSHYVAHVNRYCLLISHGLASGLFEPLTMAHELLIIRCL